MRCYSLVMKNKFIHYISIILVTIVAFTSVIQFHHHDCDGNIYIHMTTFDDLSLDDSHHEYEHCCHHNHDNEHSDCDGKKGCSMHLGDFTVSRQHDIDTIALLPLFDWATFECLSDENIIAESVSNQTGCKDKILLPGKLIVESTAFRAPPSVLG